MSETRRPKRLYSETEVGALLQRATELQHAAEDAVDHGLSMEEVEHIAAEIGIAREHVRNAAAEVESRTDGGPFSLWGGPYEVERRTVVEGTLTEEQWEQIVLGLRRLTGSTGKTEQIGTTREWYRVVKDLDYTIARTQVSVRPGTGQIAIDVANHFGGGARMAYVLGVLFGGTAAGIFLDGGGLPDVINTLILAGSGIGGVAAARVGIGMWARRQQRRVTQIMEWLQDALGAAERSTSATAGAPPLTVEETEPQASELSARSRPLRA